jgi:AraC-like DNA-binding protein
MLEYREIGPSTALAGSVECFWTLRSDGPATAHRVSPDGCADILFTDGNLQVVGAMTRYQDYPHPAGGRVTGVRFRPGAWAGYFGIPGNRITDTILPLEELWGARARQLRERLGSANSLEQCAAIVEASMSRSEKPTPVERAIRWMEQCHGVVSIDQVAGHCGLSPRQFRRLCLEQSGLSPKFLARVLRFRRAVSRLANSKANGADLAVDCGYYDQAHFINEFREFCGRTPSAVVE